MNLDNGRYQLELATRRRERRPQYRTIEPGSTNKRAVRALQERLSELGYEVSTDGEFGRETEAALKEFQRHAGTSDDGILGRKTLNKLLKAKQPEGNPADVGIDAITAVVAPGMAQTARDTANLGRVKAEINGGGSKSHKGDSTSKTKLGPHGGTLDATGHEIATSKTGPIGSTKPDPMVGYTWDKGSPKPGHPDVPTTPQNQQFEELHPRGKEGSPNGGQFVAKGDSGQLVANTQNALNDANKSGLKVDGQFGDKTDAAVREFQSQNNLRVDGKVGLQTTAALRRQMGINKKVGARRKKVEAAA